MWVFDYQSFLREFLLTHSRDLGITEIVEYLVVPQPFAGAFVKFGKDAQNDSSIATEIHRRCHSIGARSAVAMKSAGRIHPARGPGIRGRISPRSGQAWTNTSMAQLYLGISEGRAARGFDVYQRRGLTHFDTCKF